jgi:phosphoribosylglycinamide formyltransferase-1
MFGLNVHRAVLKSGVSTTGATVHHVHADYDTGPIMSQTEVAVSASDTIDTLADRVQQAERELLIRTLRTILINHRP